jgi:ribA/ribD-fused uncharacterized protein
MQPAPATRVIRFYSNETKYFEFSNFYPAKITIDDVEWPTTEHYFQAQKFIATDPKYAEKIRTTETPGAAKQLGRSTYVPLREDWDEVKEAVMYKCCKAKFTQNEKLKKKLIDTGIAELQENAKNDYTWGIGADGSGSNLLGKILMKIRAEITPPAPEPFYKK